MTVRERVAQLVEALPEVYPGAHCELDFKNPLQLLVATILSAQSTDKRVNMVTPNLFARYRTAADFARVPQETLENEIRSTGFFRNKAKAIQGACKLIAEQHGGRVPDTMEELLALPGVARKTANVVLGNAFRIASGIVVDTHVSRLSQRLKLTAHEQPEKIERDLCALIPETNWIDFSHLLIAHGRAVCKARTPLCAQCFLLDLCPTGEELMAAE